MQPTLSAPPSALSPQALKKLQQQCRQWPRRADLWQQLARHSQQQKQFSIAASAYAHLSKLLPTVQQASTWQQAGVCYQQAGDYPHAVSAYQKALHQDPDNAQLRLLLMQMAQQTGDQQQTRQQAGWLAENASSILLIQQAYTVLNQLGDTAAAAKLMVRAMSLFPEAKVRWYKDLSTWQQDLQWDAVRIMTRALWQRYQAPDAATYLDESPFNHVSWCQDEAINLQQSQAVCARLFGRIDRQIKRMPALSQRRLRIGYLSSDFCNHATLHLFLGVLREHDTSRFEVVAYDHSPIAKSDNYRQLFEQTVRHRVAIHDMTDAQAAARIEADGIDILVDLKGHTKDNRLAILAHRPAPVQVTYLGMPRTSGADFIDFVIADPIVVPDTSRVHYSEAVCRLPESYFCTDNQRFIDTTSSCREDHGLPQEAIVLCSFNQLYKVTEATWQSWLSILVRIPETVLWVLAPSQTGRVVLQQSLVAHGIDSQRLIFADRTGQAKNLERMQHADLMLDTEIYNAHTTAVDALWAGVPIVAVKGGHFASRVSASLLQACGLPELITHNLDEMADLAVALSRSPATLQALKQKLREQRRVQPLFDTVRFTRHLEMAYQHMAAQHLADKPPVSFDVPPLPARTTSFMTDPPRRRVQQGR
ncbi:TPR domain protein, putative component of TonB system [Methylophaga frappieri]|uniref:protein O-GlcNAc transferase n=1 Tax=Methylophaga frappieri (strain ATCC BAA-2434 / DSM 25690 / JAM7) TaxID=754477 RepID=I1YKJ9_METFJ|nr:tetratricopeptide repeat protein [Methylophaga frappieri]AFJ03442.1 TPR domain protein, putative component of TonB system [Methylophaga frappieri]